MIFYVCAAGSVKSFINVLAIAYREAINDVVIDNWLYKNYLRL